MRHLIFDVEERALRLGEYITATGCTVREAASVFHLSKSTVHKDVAKRLPKLDPVLARAARIVLDRNKAERHIRGGEATRKKYARL